mgnify:CR=1 FL=1
MLITIGARLRVLREALMLVQEGHVRVESAKGGRLILQLTDVEPGAVQPLMKVIASWIGRTPIARLRGKRLIIQL